MQIKEQLLKYCEDIIEGNILASKKHIQAVKRFSNDLERIGNKDFPYEFSFEKVEDIYEWAKLFKHSKGILATSKDPYIKLTPFQLFIIGNIFGWTKKGTEYKRFRKSYIQLARKNAKSQLLAIIASYEAFLSKEKGEIYISGWAKDTSEIVYNEILTQIKGVEFLKGTFNDAYKKITTHGNGSIIKPLSREARRFGDGTSPSLAILDEFHSHQDSSIYDVLASGMVARPSGHIAIITTAGFNLYGPCYKEYEYVSKLLDSNSVVENEEYFAIICELDSDDDIKDEKNWIKANPIVATYKEGLDFLRSELKTALEMEEKKRNFLTKNLNLWVQDVPNNYIPLDKWDEITDDSLTFESVRGLPCVVGVDLSQKLDITSVSFIFSKDEKLLVLNHSFIPEDTLETKRKTDRVPYDLYKEKGYLSTTAGAVVDYRYIERFIIDKEQEYDLNIREICCDPWNASQFLQELDSKGYKAVEVAQRITTMSPAVKNFKERVYQKSVIVHKNDLLKWSLGNAITKSDINENLMLDKSRSTNRIDPIVSVIVGHVRSDSLENKVDLSEHILSGDFSF